MGEDKLEWFEPKQMSEEQLKKLKECREAFKQLMRTLEPAIGGGRRQSIVWTHLEEAAMMVTKSISHG